MKSINERIKTYKKKSIWSKVTDIIFITFIIALFIPSSRLAIGGFVNRIKSMIIQPSEIETTDEQRLSENDYKWELSDIHGSTFKFENTKDKVIFLNFWATWCPPCVGEMPEIQKLYDTYKNNDNIVFLIVTSEDIKAVQNFLSKRDYNFPVYLSKYRPPEIFNSQSIPTTFIISKDGTIKVKEKGAQNWSGEKTIDIINKLINN